MNRVLGIVVVGVVLGVVFGFAAKDKQADENKREGAKVAAEMTSTPAPVRPAQPSRSLTSLPPTAREVAAEQITLALKSVSEGARVVPVYGDLVFVGDPACRKDDLERIYDALTQFPDMKEAFAQFSSFSCEEGETLWLAHKR